MKELSTEQILALVNFTLIEDEGVHYHWDPETQFYNQCHDENGRFCSDPISGRTNIRDSDGTPSKTGEIPEKRGKLGASLKDPHEGTVAFDGVRGYVDSKNPKDRKPVPGTDAYLEAHNIAPDIFESRPYIKYEASKQDEALHTAYPKDQHTPGFNYSKGHRLFVGTAEDTDPQQSGGYIMYKNPVPGTEHGKISPQIRPNAPVVTDKSARAKALTELNRHKDRLAVLEKTTPDQLIKERRAEVKRAKLDLARAEKATPELVKAEAVKELAAARTKLAKIKESTTDPDVLNEAKKEFNREKKRHDKVVGTATKQGTADRPTFKEALMESKTLHLQSAENRLKSAMADPEGALAGEIKRLNGKNGLIKRAQNAYDKTAAKYLFTPGESSARIDCSQDPVNIKNLTKGKGRIYLAMEGSIKNDAILTALRKEDPTAAVVNVPSVTLWQQKNLTAEIPSEMSWFTKTYAKNREVILIPDADGVKNNAVMMQAKALKSVLQSNGAGQVYLATPPLKPGTTRIVEEFDLPSGKTEERKGIDDHLGAGRGTLGQLRFRTAVERPSYDLMHLTKAGGKEGTKLSAGGLENAEKVLGAISDLVEERGIGQIPLKTLNQAAGFRKTQKTVARDARTNLEKHGIIKVEWVYDDKALSRGERILNPNMTEKRRDELVKMGVVKEPHIYKRYTETSMDESPVISILKPEYIIRPENIRTGSLAELPSWKPPKTFTGWTSAVTGKPDTTGIAKQQEENHKKFIAKNAAKGNPSVSPAKTTAQRLAEKKAPTGRRLVRTAEGAARYGVPIGSPIPVPGSFAITNTVLLSSVMSDEEIVEFYNRCHDENGRFCEGEDGAGRLRDKDESVSGGFRFGKKVKVDTVADAGLIGTVEVDGIKAKKVYSAKTKDGTEIKLYDKSGKAGRHADELLANHVKMHEKYPLMPPRSIIVEAADAATGIAINSVFGSSKAVPKDTFAIVYGNKPHTYVNADMLGVDVGDFKDGFQMPSAKKGDTDNMDYLLTHEYGHHVDFARHSDNGFNYDRHPLWDVPQFKENMSRYGKSDARGVEAYSEAFAEWHHSNGETKNPSAIAMARYEGWTGAESLRASGEQVSLTHQGLVHFADKNESESLEDYKGIVVIDSFDGPKVMGDFKVNEPSKEDVARAKKIMDEVMKELGLNSEGA